MLPALKRISGFFAKDLWEIDTGSLDRTKAYLVRLAKFLYLALREFSEGQLSFRAMSLVYTTLLSIVPLLAVSFSVLKAFGVYNQAEPFLSRFLAPLGPSGEEITRRIIGFVGNMKVGVLGSVGLSMLIYTVISLIYKMEDSLNYIWRIKTPRSLSRRFSDYMSVLLVGPILIFSAVGLTAAIKSATIVQWLMSIGPLGFAFYVLSVLIPYVTTSGAFTFCYVFIPSTKVELRSAMAGGIFAGVVWQVSGWAFASFVASSAQYSAIYSGFAILVLFMMWMYLSWLVFLVGGSLSFYHQRPQYLILRKERIALSGRLKERLALSIMFLIGYNFYHNKPPWTLDSLMARLKLPLEPVQEVTALLEKKGLILDAGDAVPAYLPARDTETISLQEVLDSARGAGEDTLAFEEKSLILDAVDEVIRRMGDSVSATLKDETIKGLVLSSKG